MNQTKSATIDELASSIGLNENQTNAIKEYILSLLVDNFRQMKDEYNQEIDAAIKNLNSYQEQ